MTNRTVEDYVNNVDLRHKNYIPGEFALGFVNFIKLVNGGGGEENLTPVLHYKMLDQIPGNGMDILNMLFRGSAKTTLMGEYLFLYLAVYESIPGFGPVPLGIYVSDSIENGVKNMRMNLEYRWQNSEFLQHYVPNTRFTDIRWEFGNKRGNKLIVKGYGASTGVRGSKELGTRPVLAVLDDLVSDTDAKSPTVISTIEDTVYRAVDYALHPTMRKIIWSGTPFNSRDPLYKAVESGAWKVNVFPVCEKFPCTREEFVGAWEDRFTYDSVLKQYEKSLKTGQIASFNQEMMLRIMSDEERLIQTDEVLWYRRSAVLQNRGAFNFYITTDFATSERTASDPSVISVWAYNSNGDWLWVDGMLERQLMDKNLDALFTFAQIYTPQSVGIEVSGQQAGFITWIKNEMLTRNIYFNLATQENTSKEGIRPTTDKLTRFLLMVPFFKMGKIFFPEEMRNSKVLKEAVDELSLASVGGLKSKNDDFIDTVSMLASMKAWKPSQSIPMSATTAKGTHDVIWGDEDESQELTNSYIV